MNISSQLALTAKTNPMKEAYVFEGDSKTYAELNAAIKTTSVNWWFALRLKASLTGLGLKGPLKGFPFCTTFSHQF